MAIKRILVIFCVMLFAFTASYLPGGRATVTDIITSPQASAGTYIVGKNFASVNSRDPFSQLTKKRKLKIRYMKAEIGNITPILAEIVESVAFSDEVSEAFYSFIFYSEYHKLYKLRGPPFVLLFESMSAKA